MTPPPATSFSLEWAGLVRTCLLPSSATGRGKIAPRVTALDFLKPDQRWDPAGSPSKISAMWSLGVSEVKPGTRGGTSPGWDCRGQRPGAEWEGTWGRSKLEQQLKGSKPERFGWRCCPFNTVTPPPNLSGQDKNSSPAQSPTLPPPSVLSPVLFITVNSQLRGPYCSQR